MKAIIMDNYNRICEAMLALKLEELEPSIALRKGLACFAHFMIEHPEQYKVAKLSELNSEMKKYENKEVMALLFCQLYHPLWAYFPMREMDNII